MCRVSDQLLVTECVGVRFERIGVSVRVIHALVLVDSEFQQHGVIHLQLIFAPFQVIENLLHSFVDPFDPAVLFRRPRFATPDLNFKSIHQIPEIQICIFISINKILHTFYSHRSQIMTKEGGKKALETV